MGHIRLGVLPATRRWQDVVALLDESKFRIADIANAIVRASDRSLARAVDDPAFVEALWLLLKIPIAAKQADFRAELAALGILVPPDPMLVDILGAFVDVIDRARYRAALAVTDFSLIARNAAMAALESLTLDRSPSLWKPSAIDERTTIASFAATEQFGELAQRFFTNLVEGHLQYFLDREIPRHIGNGGMIRSVGDTTYFESAVHRHCREATVIMRAFARDWLGKHRFHLGKDLTRLDAVRFAAVAFTKVRKELSSRSGIQNAAV
ncbi:hypothetical protein ACVWWD_000337 [Mesorhizobium sp. URHB0026]